VKTLMYIMCDAYMVVNKTLMYININIYIYMFVCVNIYKF
jgi:hypothetical protein